MPVLKNLNEVTPLADDTLEALLGPVAFPKYQASDHADDEYEVRRTVWENKHKELRDDVADANIARTQYIRHPKSTAEGKAREDALVAKAEKKLRDHEGERPNNFSRFRELKEAVRKIGRGWRDKTQPAIRPVEIVPDKKQPAALADRVPYYGDAIAANAAATKDLEGRVLPREIVAEKVRADVRALFKQCRPNTTRTRRLHKDPDTGRLKQGSVHFPTVTRDMGGMLVDEPNWGLMALWAVADSFEQQCVDLALKDFNDDDDDDLATRDEKLAALEAERKRLMYCAEAALADCRAAGINAARTWPFDALFYLGVELNT